MLEAEGIITSDERPDRSRTNENEKEDDDIDLIQSEWCELVEQQQRERLDSDPREELENEYGYFMDIDQRAPEFQVAGLENQNTRRTVRRMENEEYMRKMCILNRGQHMYMMEFMRTMRTNKPFYHFISGGAGTGKSHLLECMNDTGIRYWMREYDTRSIGPDPNTSPFTLICSPTGMAAFKVKGVTLHFGLGLPRCNELGPLTGDKLQENKKFYANLKLLIIDEISMASAAMLRKIDSRLRQIKGEMYVPFGGVSVAVFGDLHQLTPVLGGRVFNYVPEDENAYHELQMYAAGDDLNNLWHLFKLHELTEIMRQREDLAFAKALATLGTYGVFGLEKSELDLFNSRIVDKNDIPPEAMVLSFTNDSVKELNAEK